MKQINSVERIIVNRLLFLKKDYGFMSPIFHRDKWTTTISFLSAHIAFEVELNWRDFEVFILVTKLNNGVLPGGYYMCEGKRVRMHLEEILTKVYTHNKKYAKESFKEIPRPIQGNEDSLITTINIYSNLIRENVSTLLLVGAKSFDC